jgi:hypothetical protein
MGEWVLLNDDSKGEGRNQRPMRGRVYEWPGVLLGSCQDPCHLDVQDTEQRIVVVLYNPGAPSELMTVGKGGRTGCSIKAAG